MKGVNMKATAGSVLRLVTATALFSTGLAAAQTDAGSRIAVYDEVYRFRGSQFEDLDALETQVRAASPRVIEIDICGTSTARALKSAAHRFRDRPLLLRVNDQNDPTCALAAQPMRVSQRAGGGPTGIDDAAVADYWRQVIP
jgi:hypothetical protein